jgi:hypothetical protein
MENPDEMPPEMVDLRKAIESLPHLHSSYLLTKLEKVEDSIKRRRRILALVQDALSQLRLDIKYLMFDLQVTRRERDALQDKNDLNGGDN